jgi:peptide-methionine (R)-S-oxide reductase
MMNRRTFFLSGAAALFGAGAYGLLGASRSDAGQNGAFPLNLSDAEWRKRLTSDQYAILRKHATERAFTSPLNNEKRDGVFHCAGCEQALYSSKTKFDSGTGWPSFYEALPNAVGTSTDTSFFMTRTEVHCSNCGGHLGHIFDDGPKPTGKRHCINGIAMAFRPTNV